MRIAVCPETGATDHPDAYAGGDCANCGAEVVNAAAEWLRAARAEQPLAWQRDLHARSRIQLLCDSSRLILCCFRFPVMIAQGNRRP